MKRLYLGFSKAKSKWSIISGLIRWAQQTPFSHVYVRFDSDFLQRTFIYQASGSKVNFENIISFEKHSVVIQEFEIDIAPEVYKTIMQFAIDTVGKPYSVCQLFGMAWALFGRKLGFKTQNFYKDRTDAFVCSEIGAYVLALAGKNVPEDRDSLGPKEVFDLVNR